MRLLVNRHGTFFEVLKVLNDSHVLIKGDLNFSSLCNEFQGGLGWNDFELLAELRRITFLSFFECSSPVKFFNFYIYLVCAIIDNFFNDFYFNNFLLYCGRLNFNYDLFRNDICKSFIDNDCDILSDSIFTICNSYLDRVLS